MPALRSSVDGKHFENGGFRKRWLHDIHVISLTKFPSIKNERLLLFSNFSGAVQTGGGGASINLSFAFHFSVNNLRVAFVFRTVLKDFAL